MILKFSLKWSIIYLFSSLSLLTLYACQKNDHVNPYDEQELPENTLDSTGVNLDPTSFDGLHANIFSKSCAVSGCHDGNFEPDFRTIESSYNTLVDQPIIKNDPQNTYEVRVKPGNPTQSVLVARMTFDIDGNSGIMPLVIDTNSDWAEKKEEYIQNVKDWIQKGALR